MGSGVSTQVSVSSNGVSVANYCTQSNEIFSSFTSNKILFCLLNGFAAYTYSSLLYVFDDTIVKQHVWRNLTSLLTSFGFSLLIPANHQIKLFIIVDLIFTILFVYRNTKAIIT